VKRKSVSATECYWWHGGNALFDNGGPEDRSAILRETVTGDHGNRLCSPLALAALKGTHARDFHSLFLNDFLHLSVTNRYKTQFSQRFRKYSLNLPRYLKFLITPRFRRKREAWLSVVAENAELNLALSS
jgi:hypothetical protein